MALPISASLISAQAQAYVSPKNARPYAPPQVEKLAARGSSNAVQVEISAEARQAQQTRQDTRQADETRRQDDRRWPPAQTGARHAGLVNFPHAGDRG